jgi:hypothetical protein
VAFFKKLYHRVYQNYVMPDRLAEYGRVLRSFRDAGYRFATMAEFAGALKANAPLAPPVFLLRCDVDSDPAGAARMFGTEQALGVRATYYFRLATVDRALIARMASYGTEVGYHFEEIATVAKQRGLGTKKQITPHLGEMRDAFRRNMAWFKATTGVSPRTIASHGDFINRRLGIQNNLLLDQALMDEFGLVAETYEPWLMAAISTRVADRAAPQWWHPHDPWVALQKRAPIVNMLVHPRQWIRNPVLNAGLDAARVGEELGYLLRRARMSAGAP